MAACWEGKFLTGKCFEEECRQLDALDERLNVLIQLEQTQNLPHLLRLSPPLPIIFMVSLSTIYLLSLSLANERKPLGRRCGRRAHSSHEIGIPHLQLALFPLLAISARKVWREIFMHPISVWARTCMLKSGR